MKEIQIIKYECEICGETYSKPEDALSCEGKPISGDKGVKIGDTVLVTGGEGAGQKGIVEKTWIFDKYWGHYAWERYWHTVGLTVKMIESYGNRQLTFDQYKTLITD